MELQQNEEVYFKHCGKWVKRKVVQVNDHNQVLLEDDKGKWVLKKTDVISKEPVEE